MSNGNTCAWVTDKTPECKSKGTVECRPVDAGDTMRIGKKWFCKPHARAACFGPFPKDYPRVWEIIGGKWP